MTEQGGTREDIELVLDECPELVTPWGGQIVEKAKVIRGDRVSFRLTDPEVMIRIPALPCPTLEELKTKYSRIRKIKRDDSPIKAVTLRLGTILQSTESDGISGKAYERRLIPLRGKTLGYQQREWMFKHQLEFPALMALPEEVCIGFSGIIVVNDSSDRLAPYAYWNGKRWDDGWRWLGSDFESHDRLAVSGKAA